VIQPQSTAKGCGFVVRMSSNAEQAAHGSIVATLKQLLAL
jgi:hypothetical protein